jgi:hypothetical protein
MKAFFHLLAIAVILLMTATAVETRASERLDVNPPPLLEQISDINYNELNAQTFADTAATSCGTIQLFDEPCAFRAILLTALPEATPWAIAGPRQFAAMSTDDYKMLVLAERPPRSRQYMTSMRTEEQSFANAR